MTPNACVIPLGMRGEREARIILEVSWASWKVVSVVQWRQS